MLTMDEAKIKALTDLKNIWTDKNDEPLLGNGL